MSDRTSAQISLAVLVVVAVAACDSQEAQPLPDNDLLVAVQEAKYKEWERGPGTEERKPTLAPHAGAVEIFVNDVVVTARANEDGLGLTEWPEGSTVVLEGYANVETTELAQLAVLQKRHGVWRWEQYQADDLERPRFAGRPGVCLGCHNTGQDFMRSFSLPKPVEE